MKLRLHGHSLRLRLAPTEVATLLTGAPLIHTTRFSPDTQLTVRLQTCAAVSLSATFNGSTITLLLPHESACQWASSEEVAIRAEQPVDHSNSLSLLIEKDFHCLHGEETHPDAFPHPLAPAP